MAEALVYFLLASEDNIEVQVKGRLLNIDFFQDWQILSTDKIVQHNLFPIINVLIGFL